MLCLFTLYYTQQSGEKFLRFSSPCPYCTVCNLPFDKLHVVQYKLCNYIFCSFAFQLKCPLEIAVQLLCNRAANMNNFFPLQYAYLLS